MNKKEVLRELKVLLPCEQFVVTGSYALQQMGLVTESSDLDIILVNPTDESKNILERFQAEYPALTKFEYESRGYIFMKGELKIDIFIETIKEETELTIDGILIAKINHIIGAKKSYGRIKDWFQLRKISRLFFKEEEFQIFLNSK